MDEKINILVEILKKSKNTVFFGGAGVSTESGIPDFRSSSGIFNTKLNTHFSPEELVSHSFFYNNTEDFYEFYKTKLIYPLAKPNDAHISLVKLENLGKLKAIITQNIDGLHQMAGSKSVFELHGSILRNYCINCKKFYNEEYILNSKGIPLCNICSGIIKPDVVLYEESLDNKILKSAISAISAADTLIVGGTSLIVYPAASLIEYFHGDNLVLINKTPTPADKRANLVIHDSIGSVLSQTIDLLIQH